uniref:Phosphatidylserine decarboxylase proenzyme n=1 Tax=Acidobacterium capsulatum TaxID=33075 RepID=A0A7V4XU62_9BACT
MVRDGYFYGLALLVVAVIVHLLTGGWSWAVLPLLLAAFFLWFFRDPKRAIPGGEGLVVSPADGKVTEVARIRTPQGELQRISIFLSVFDVHVNRSPVAGTIASVAYQKGLYLNAMDPASAEKNEQNTVVVRADAGYEITFKQIAGLLARRIVFNKRVGDRVERGQRVGLIKFGSRTDILMPPGFEILVRQGQRVSGGSTILARATEGTGVLAAAPSAPGTLASTERPI